MFIFAFWPKTYGQDFYSTPVSFTPSPVDFKISQPLAHLDLVNYEASTRGLYAGNPTEFRLHLRHIQWTNWGVFMKVRWDEDLDASNGYQWSQWEDNNSAGYFRTVYKTYSTPGKYTVAFEIRFHNTNGSQTYSRIKEYEVFVAPMPTYVYQDGVGNKLFYFQGADHTYDRPVFLVEGFDPENGNTPAMSYSLGADVINLARSQGYDVFIMEFANGGIDLFQNKDVFLSACRFLRSLLGTTEAAIQVVGVSMGGTIARIGLAWAEDNGLTAHPGQHMEHFVNTFISFDSPQQGAHLNLGLQEYIRDNGNQLQQLVLQSVAAKQMLYENPYGSLHDAFYADIRSQHNEEQPYGYTNGYPKRCANFAVSNGNHQAVYPNLTTNDDLATLSIFPRITAFNMIEFPQPREQIHIRAVQRDWWPGSTFTHDLTTLSTHGTRFLARFIFGPFFIDADATWRFDVNFNPSYTPTESSLDLNGYTRTANGSLISGGSWFDASLEQSVSHRHEELTDDSKVQIMNWLNNNRLNPYLGRPINPTTDVSLSDITVRFTDEATYEQGFKVERKDHGSEFVEIASLPPNTTQFVDPASGLVPFVVYTYRVRSFHGVKTSAWSQEVSAQVQSHLATNTVSATGVNGQRKVTSYAGVSHEVYESNGSIWYTRSTNGTVWEAEKRLSLTTRSKNGSIAVTQPTAGTAYIHAVWEENDLANPAKWSVMYNYSTNGGASWQAARAIATNNLATTTPVVAGNGVRATVIWRGETGLMGNVEPRLYGAIHPLPVTDATVRDFSAAPFGLSSGRHKFLVSYVQGPPTTGKVYVTWVEYNGIYNPLISGTSTNISGQYTWMSDCAHSSITGANSRIFIAWDAKCSWDRIESSPALTPTLVRHALVREWNGSTWLPVREFDHPTHEGSAPVVGIDLRPGINKVNVVWQCATHVAHASRSFTGTIWSTINNLGQGYAPNLSEVVSQTNERMWGTWATGAHFPFTITLHPFDNITFPEGEVDRVAEINLEEPEQSLVPGVMGSLVVRAARFELVTGTARTRLPFRPDNGDFSDWLETGVFTIQNGTDSIVGSAVISLRGFSIRDPRAPLSTPILSMAVQSQGQTSVIRTLTLRDLARIGSADTLLRYRHAAPARALWGKSIKIKQRVYGQDQGFAPRWSEIVSTSPGSNEQNNASLGQDEHFAMPATYALHQNYPNPFNPSTRIAYDMPEGGSVSLTVFNMLGQRVATLANGFVEPGRYSVEWDGSSEDGSMVASGVYLARLFVVKTNGETAFTETRKLVMMK